MPDNATAEEIANLAAATFQEALRNFNDLPIVPEMTRENVLANVVLQALSRKRNRQLLKAHPHVPFLDLAGVFRVPVGPYRRNSLSTALITNQIFEKLELTIDELTEVARRNTVSKFGIQLISIQEMNKCFTQGHHQEPKPFGEVQMVPPGLYTLTNGIEINGVALRMRLVWETENSRASGTITQSNYVWMANNFVMPLNFAGNMIWDTVP